MAMKDILNLDSIIRNYLIGLNSMLSNKSNIGIDPNVSKDKNPQILANIIEISCLDSNLIKQSLFIELINNLISLQQNSGSWIEIHRNYYQPSALITSICVISLEKALHLINSNLIEIQNYQAIRSEIDESIRKGQMYVKKQFRGHSIKKSELIRLKILNVNAIASNALPEVAPSLLKGISLYQKKNGAIPYSDPIRKHPFDYPLNFFSIFYHCLTLYYISQLIKKPHFSSEEWMIHSYKLGLNRLRSVIKKSGDIKWIESRFPHADYQNNTYAFILRLLFLELSQIQKNNLYKRLVKNISNVGLSYTYEIGKKHTLIFRLFFSIRYLFGDRLKIKDRVKRVLHSCYQEYARTFPTQKIHPSILYRLTKNSFSQPPPYNLPNYVVTLEILKLLLELREEIGIRV
ncbi:MAG: hypothetical protein ACFE9S_10495 [Candidatus Hermodarchaeota archaeon]